MTADVTSIGEPLYELNQQPDGRFLPGFGGDTLNVAIAAARLGCRAAYVTRLGGDIFGDALMELMRREGLDVSGVARDPDAPTGLYFVTHGLSGHVFTYRRAGSAASRMTPELVDPAMIARTRYFHASGISQAISRQAAETVRAAIEVARGAGALISFDTNFRPRLWSPAEAWPEISAAAGLADILKTSIEDSAALIGLAEPAAVAEYFLRLGAKSVVVTLGPDGIYLGGKGLAVRIPGFALESVDATGAGDAFTGALLAELAAGRAIEDAARFANAAAALSTLGYGAIAPLPTRDQVETFLARY